MKKIKEIPVEVKHEIVEEEGGLITLLGKRVCLLGLNYIYCGDLTGVNTTCIELQNAGIVYLTGEWNLPQWKDYQKLPTQKTFVRIETIESFFEVSK